MDGFRIVQNPVLPMVSSSVSSPSCADAQKLQTKDESPPTDRAWIRDLVVGLMKRSNIQYHGPGQPIAQFEAVCVAEASARGYLADEDPAIRRSLAVGVLMGAHTYAHLPDESVRVYIALYTFFVTYIDDLATSQPEALREFVSRFVARQPQQLKVLDDFASFLLEVPRVHNGVACNIILINSLEFMSSYPIQYDVLGIPIPASATEYPMFFRRLTGIGNAYAAFMFPASMPVNEWLYALPDIAYCLCTFNDILSFYKEDLDGEVEDTLPWLLAHNRNTSVSESLRSITNDSVELHNRVLSTLSPSQDACDAYRKAIRGYTSFHIDSKRYRLKELGL